MSIRVWYCVKDDKFFPTMSAGIDHCHYHVEKYGGVEAKLTKTMKGT